MERKIVFRPAFDRRDPDPSKNYGIHGMEIQFQLIGDGEGITYTIFTNWMLPHVQEETDSRPVDHRFPYLFHKPQSAGMDGHWKTPRYEGQNRVESCRITDGICYCDGTAITQDAFNILVAEGEEALWKLMEERFISWSKTE